MDESTNILNQIPGLGINKIEVIINPLVKYYASHAWGIINIITKRNELYGFSGLVNGSASTAELYNGDVFFNYRTKKVNITLSAGAYQSPIYQARSSIEKRLVKGQSGFQNFHSDNIQLSAILLIFIETNSQKFVLVLYSIT